MERSLIRFIAGTVIGLFIAPMVYDLFKTVLIYIITTSFNIDAFSCEMLYVSLTNEHFKPGITIFSQILDVDLD